jgi:exodeoxyribonuclease VIII
LRFILNYHDHPAVSASKLKKIACGTPLDYWAAYEDPDRTPIQPTDAMKQGSLVDCLITEPHNFHRKYVIAPNVDRRTKAGKQEWSEAADLARVNCSTLIPFDWHHTASMIVERLKADPVASEYLHGQGQNPHFWHDRDFGLDCRYLPDIEQPEEGMLIDLKKTRSANPKHFERQAYSLGYDIQVAHYAEGFLSRHGKYPSGIVLFAYEDLLEEGRRRRDEAMATINECLTSNSWPSWGVNEMNAPKWVKIEDPANDTDVSDLELEGI